MRQIFDDGTWIETDSGGNVTAYSDTNGNSFQPDRTVFTQFVNAILGGVSSAINRSLTPAAAPISASQVAGGGLMTLMLLGGAAYLLLRETPSH